jgi:hypothetical protein
MPNRGYLTIKVTGIQTWKRNSLTAVIGIFPIIGLIYGNETPIIDQTTSINSKLIADTNQTKEQAVTQQKNTLKANMSRYIRVLMCKIQDKSLVLPRLNSLFCMTLDDVISALLVLQHHTELVANLSSVVVNQFQRNRLGYVLKKSKIAEFFLSRLFCRLLINIIKN